MHNISGRLNPSSLAHGGSHGIGDHVILQQDGFAKLYVLVGAKQLPATEVQANRHKLRKRKLVGFCQRRCCQYRANGARLKPNHVRFAVAGSLRKEDTAKTVGDATGKGQQ